MKADRIFFTPLRPCYILYYFICPDWYCAVLVFQIAYIDCNSSTVDQWQRSSVRSTPSFILWNYRWRFCFWWLRSILLLQICAVRQLLTSSFFLIIRFTVQVCEAQYGLQRATSVQSIAYIKEVSNLFTFALSSRNGATMSLLLDFRIISSDCDTVMRVDFEIEDTW